MYLERYEVLPDDHAIVARRSWISNPDAAPILSPQVVQHVVVKREPVIPNKTAKEQMEERPRVYSGETKYLHNAANPRLLSENVELLEITRI